MILATQQHDSASQLEASLQAQHPQYVEAANNFNVDKYITASDADAPDAWQVQPVSQYDQQHEWSAVDQQRTDNLESMPEEDFQHSLPLHGYVLTQDCGHTSPRHAFLLLSYVLDCREEHGPNVWVGDLELATPTAAFGKP